MAPLILHNVPDEELYVGDDGITRPYAMVFPQQDLNQASIRGSRRSAAESGAFGKSTRRSRSKTATPARREDPTIQSADKIFSKWLNDQEQHPDDGDAPATKAAPQRKQTSASKAAAAAAADDAASATAAKRNVSKEPTEVILRGFKSSGQQYAAINHYEQLAGRICEDYPRDPPLENRRYKSELRDPAFTRRRPLTPEERAKVNRADSGRHWVKVTFESAQAAESAIFASPQAVLGHLVYAEPYHGIPPSRDEAVPDATTLALGDEIPRAWRRPGMGGNRTAAELRQPFAGTYGLPREIVAGDDDEVELSPPQSQTSSRTIDSSTLGGTTSSTTTVLGQPVAAPASAAASASAAPAAPSTPDANSEFCRRIPTARKVRLLPAEQALLPQPSYLQRALSRVPFLQWFSGSMIGNEVPRTEAGEFDWDRASLYWKMVYWLDSVFGLFGGEIMGPDKDD